MTQTHNLSVAKSSYFSHWSRKSYSIFNSIHKVIHIGVLSTSCFITLLSTSLSAQTQSSSDSTTVHALDEVQVEEALPVEIQSQQTRIVSVISKQEIQSSAATSIDDILEYALNVDIRNRGTKGTQSDISIRGGSFDQTMILLNGINITDPQTGHHNLIIPISLDAIDHIEILSGPGAVKWGSNAFSGAINIVTKPEGKNITAELSGGQHQLYNTQLSAHAQTGAVSHLASFNASGSDGYAPNTDFKNESLYYQGKYTTQEGNTSWQLGQTNRAYGANAFYSPSYPNQFEQEAVTLASIKWESSGKIKFSPSLYYRRNQSHFELFRNMTDAPSWYTGHNYHLNEVYGSNLLVSYMSSWGLTQVGGTMRNESILSNVLGNPMNDSIPVKGNSDAAYTHSYSRTNISWFVEHRVSLNKFYGAVTLMLNHNSALPNSLDFFPGLEMSYQWTKDWKTYLTLNRSMRMPTFTDLFYSGASNIGNPLLQPETATTYEAGMKYNNAQGISAHASTFYRQGRNLIDWVKDQPEDKWRSVNHAAINTWGAEVAIKGNIEQFLAHSCLIKNIGIGYSHTQANQEQASGISNYEMAYLKDKLNLSLTHALFSSLSAHWNINYQNRNGQYEKYEGSTFIENANYAPFWLTDLKIIWTRKHYEIYAEASNLFNTQYNDVGSITQAGRWISTGIKLNF